jgi:hypothetical protein
MKKTFCDGCGCELTRTTKSIRLSHTFPNGVTVEAEVKFGSDVNGVLQAPSLQHPTGKKSVVWNDGDFCDTCLETAVREGWPE